MSVRLRSYDTIPPGGFFYVQTDGIQKTFRSIPSIQDLAKAVSAFRRGNGLGRSGLDESLADIEAFTCRRLPNAAQWCVDTDSAGVVLTLPSAGGVQPCAGCGAKVNP